LNGFSDVYSYSIIEHDTAYLEKEPTARARNATPTIRADVPPSRLTDVATTAICFSRLHTKSLYPRLWVVTI
jgi:hypothetical protein